MKLSSQEEMGTGCHGYPSAKYRAKGDASVPTYMERSMRLLNQYDDHPGSDFDTNEDKSVERSIHKVIWMLLAIETIAVYTLFMIGVFKDLALGIVAALVISMLVRAVVMLTMHPQTLIDWLASRLFGAPTRPRLYIQQGLDRDLIEIDTR